MVPLLSSYIPFVQSTRKNRKFVSFFPLKPCLREFLVISRFLGTTLHNVWRGYCMPDNVLRGYCMKTLLLMSYFGTVWFTKIYKLVFRSPPQTESKDIYEINTCRGVYAMELYCWSTCMFPCLLEDEQFSF